MRSVHAEHNLFFDDLVQGFAGLVGGGRGRGGSGEIADGQRPRGGHAEEGSAGEQHGHFFVFVKFPNKSFTHPAWETL